jgi:plastocyanin
MFMHLDRYLWFLAASASLAAATPAQSNLPERGGEVRGEVILVPAAAGVSTNDASRVVVWLAPVNVLQPVRVAQKTHYRLLQHNKRFEPGLLVVPVGSVVDFPNADPWFHNVFSLYRGKRFDLGLYQAGAQRSVKFDRAGPSYLFCNIHPQMTGVVLAVDSGLFAITDKAGRYAISGVPPGKYVVRVWYENAALESLESLTIAVNVEAETKTLPLISIAVTKQTATEHKNKYGQDYDPDTLKTDY